MIMYYIPKRCRKASARAETHSALPPISLPSGDLAHACQRSARPPRNSLSRTQMTNPIRLSSKSRRSRQVLRLPILHLVGTPCLWLGDSDVSGGNGVRS